MKIRRTTALLVLGLLTAACGSTQTKTIPGSGYLLPNATVEIGPTIAYSVEQIAVAGIELATVQTRTLSRSLNLPGEIRFDEDRTAHVVPRVPGVVESVQAELGQAVYFSRSRGKLWFKGEESGHVQTVHAMRIDCDNDVVLLEVTQLGHEPGIACHTGRHSCFFSIYKDGAWVASDPVLKDPESIYK